MSRSWHPPTSRFTAWSRGLSSSTPISPLPSSTPTAANCRPQPPRFLASRSRSAADAQTHGDPLVIATVDKLADAFLRDGLGGFDVLVIDEAYQADAARYYTAAGVAPTHLLVGDTGQLDPFSPIDDATFWRGGPEDPLQTAVGVLLRNHPSTARPPHPHHLAAGSSRRSDRPVLLSRRMLSARPSGPAFVNSGSPAPGRAAVLSHPSTAPWTRRRRTAGRMSRSPARRC